VGKIQGNSVFLGAGLREPFEPFILLFHSRKQWDGGEVIVIAMSQGYIILGGVYIAMTSYSLYIHLYPSMDLIPKIHGYKYLLR
jgi:hypothetical protein